MKPKKKLKTKKNRIKNPNELTFKEHLKELRHRLFLLSTFFVVAFIFWYINCNKIISVITYVGNSCGYQLVYISPHEVLIQQIRLAALFSTITILPMILYQVCAFIAPIFDKKLALIKLFILSIMMIVLMSLGVIFSYRILLPFMYKFMYSVGIAANIAAQVSLENYINTFVSITMWMSIFTELPLVCIILTRMGILTAELMKKARPVVIVVIFIIAAIITPPDVVSQCMVAVPLIVLYQISIMICSFIRRNKHE